MARKGNYISKTGYKANSPDRGRAFNVIPSGQITMQNVPHPVIGIDEFGNQQFMMPGGEYNFPGNQVFEIPVRQRGGRTPIIVDDPQDPRLHAYQDSLNLFKGFKKAEKLFPEETGWSIPTEKAYTGDKYYDPNFKAPDTKYWNSFNEYAANKQKTDAILEEYKDADGYITDWDAVSADPRMEALHWNVASTGFKNKEDLAKYDPNSGKLAAYYETLDFHSPTSVGYWASPDLGNAEIKPTREWIGTAWNPKYRKPVQPYKYSGDPEDVAQYRYPAAISGSTKWQGKPFTGKRTSTRTTPDPDRSVSDNLKAMGQDSSFTNRKKLAEQAGITGYKGTAEQNVQLNKWLHEGGLDKQTEEKTLTSDTQTGDGSPTPLQTDDKNATEQGSTEAIVDPVVPDPNEGKSWYWSYGSEWIPDDSHPAGGYQKRVKTKVYTDASAPSYQFGGNTNFVNKQLPDMAYMNFNRFMQQGGVMPAEEVNPYVVTNPEMIQENQFSGPFYSTDRDYNAMLQQQRRDWNTWGDAPTEKELGYMQSHMYPTHDRPGGKGMINVFPMENPSAEVLAPTMNRSQKQYDQNLQILMEQMAQEKRLGGKPCYKCGGRSHQMGGAPAGYHYMPDGSLMPNNQMAEGGNWIQGVTQGIKNRGTEGKCSGKNFGGPGCPKGSPQYNLAVNFRKMAKARKKQMGGNTAPMNMDVDNVLDQRVNDYTQYIQDQVGMNITNQVDQQAEDALIAGYEAMMQMGGNTNAGNVGAYVDALNMQRGDRRQASGALIGAGMNLGLNANPYIRTKLKNEEMDYKYKYDRPWDPSFTFAKYGRNLPKAQMGIVTDPSKSGTGQSYTYPSGWFDFLEKNVGADKMDRYLGEMYSVEGSASVNNPNSPNYQPFTKENYSNPNLWDDPVAINYPGETTKGLRERQAMLEEKYGVTDENDVVDTPVKGGSSFEVAPEKKKKSGTSGSGSGSGSGSYDPSATDDNVATTEGATDDVTTENTDRGNYEGKDTKTDPVTGKVVNQGMMMYPGVAGFGNIMYNPYNTYLESMDERARLFGPGLRRRKTTFTHGPWGGGGIDPQTGQPVSGGPNAGQGYMYDDKGNVINTPDNINREEWIDKRMDPRFKSYEQEGDMTDERRAEMNAEYERLDQEYQNSRMRQMNNPPDNRPVETDFKTKFKNWRQERQAEKERKNQLRNPQDSYDSAVHPGFAKRKEEERVLEETRKREEKDQKYMDKYLDKEQRKEDKRKKKVTRRWERSNKQAGGETQFGETPFDQFMYGFNEALPGTAEDREQFRRGFMQEDPKPPYGYKQAHRNEMLKEVYDPNLGPAISAWNAWVQQNPPGSPGNPGQGISYGQWAQRTGMNTVKQYGGDTLYYGNVYHPDLIAYEDSLYDHQRGEAGFQEALKDFSKKHPDYNITRTKDRWNLDAPGSMTSGPLYRKPVVPRAWDPNNRHQQVDSQQYGGEMLMELLAMGGIPYFQGGGDYINPMDPTQIQKIDNTPNIPPINAYNSPYGSDFTNAYGQTDVDEKLKFQYGNEELVGAGIAATNWGANLLGMGEQQDLQKQIEDKLTADAQNPVISRKSAGEGTYDQWGNLIDDEKVVAQNRGYMMQGERGSNLYQGKYGKQVEYKQGGTYDIDDRELRRLTELGYEFDILD